MDVRPDHVAILVPVSLREDERWPLSLQQLGEEPPVRGTIVFVREVHKRQRLKFCLCVPQHLLIGRIRGQKAATEVHHGDAHSRALKYRPPPLLALAHLLFGALALAHLVSERFVDGCQLSGPFNNALLEFLCSSPLLARTSSLLQPYRPLVRGDAEEEHFALCWEISPPRGSDKYADFLLQPQPQRHERDLPCSERIRHHDRRGEWAVCQPAVEHSTNLLRRRRQMAVLRRPEHLDGRAINRIVHPNIGKVQAQHTEQYVEQRPDNLGRLVATPNGGQSEDTHQIIEAALQAHDLIHCLLHLHFHTLDP